jgi:hypothetical protein
MIDVEVKDPSVTKRARLRCFDHLAPVLAVGAVAIAFAAAPHASAAADGQACSDRGGATQCQRAASVQIYAKPHALPLESNPYGPFVGYHNGRN